MLASRGPCSIRSAAALLVLALALVAAPRLASAGGMRRAPARPAEPSASTDAVINGQVVDVDGHAVAGVTVLATRAFSKGAPAAGRVHPRVESDRDGKFHFSLPPGEYVFVALHRELAGMTPAMRVLHALEVVLIVAAPTVAA
jgi:hypothetical protein